jgi:hypothetical protein
VIGGLLFNAKSAIFQLYGENKFNETMMMMMMMTMSAL